MNLHRQFVEEGLVEWISYVPKFSRIYIREHKRYYFELSSDSQRWVIVKHRWAKSHTAIPKFNFWVQLWEERIQSDIIESGGFNTKKEVWEHVEKWL